jgi:hypothetical protein
MSIRAKKAIVAVLLFASNFFGFASEADAHQRRHPHASARQGPAYASSFEPARMIELRPGLFISSYACVTDEGQGRWRPCEAD